MVNNETSVLMVSPQVDKVKTYGGLGRAVLEFAKHLRTDTGCDARIIIPTNEFPKDLSSWQNIENDTQKKAIFNGDILSKEVDGVPIYLERAELPELKGGYAYANGNISYVEYNEFLDHAKTFVQKTLPKLKEVAGFNPKVIHCHDWTTALILSELNKEKNKRMATVYQIHNASYDGKIPLTRKNVCRIDLDINDLSVSGLLNNILHNGKISMQKIGTKNADLCTTVSDNYSRFLNGSYEGKDALEVNWGMANGLDATLNDFFPVSDINDFESINKYKTAKKAILFDKYKIPLEKISKPFVVMISRLEKEKGVERLLEIMPRIDDNIVVFIGGPVTDESLKLRLEECAKYYNGKHIIVPEQLERPKVYETLCAADYFLGINWGHPEPDGIVAKEASTALAIPILDTRYGSGYCDLKKSLGITTCTISPTEHNESTSRYNDDLVIALSSLSNNITDYRATIYNKIRKDAFPWKLVAEKYASEYNRILSEK